jgi:hypothetical protein
MARLIATPNQKYLPDKFVPCAVNICVAEVGINKNAVVMNLCTYHFGRAPRHIKTKLQRCLQSRDSERVPEHEKAVIEYWNNKGQQDGR